ncbi:MULTISPECIES: sulfite exporter TauE/SafE family protein [unclassified Jeotgalibaca]|uniref:sulfite exporter TauE/SafE family protein n=1 Tax=unclassified Jeotgalibaca TaxID=2621505 RepID=UPI003FD4BA37
MFGLETIEMVMLVTSALIVGFSKAGIQGATIPAVAMMAIIFGGKSSAGIMLPMLMVGDLVAIFKYGKKGNVRDVLKLIPATVVGIIAGAVIGAWINDAQFKFLIGLIVIICVVLLAIREYQKQTIPLPDNAVLKSAVGVLSGFSSMIGNAAGPIFNVYILAQNLKKETMIGTTAWFFFLMNVIKLPFHIFLWGTIDFETVKYTGFAIPFIALGAVGGIWIVNHISERWYRRLVIVMTAVTAIRLIL